MTNNQFELLGHDSPTGEYPGSVVPIGEVDGCIVAAYLSGDGVLLEPTPPDSEYVRHDALNRSRLEHFDVANERLFALAPSHVQKYRAEDEGLFFEGLLREPTMLGASPFVRYSIAKKCTNPALIARLLEECFEEASRIAPTAAVVWYESEKRRLLDMDRTVLRTATEPAAVEAELLVATYFKHLGATNIAIRPTHRDALDLYFEQLDEQGRRQRTAVFCKLFEDVTSWARIASEAITYLGDLFKRDEIDRIWLVHGFTKDPLVYDLEQVRHQLTGNVELVSLHHLRARYERLQKVAVAFVEQEHTTLGVRRDPQYWIGGSLHVGRDDQRHEAWRSYISEIEKAADNPIGDLVSIDVWSPGRRDHIRDAFRPALLNALAAYRHRSERQSGIPMSVIRHVVVNPQTFKPHFRDHLLSELREFIAHGIKLTVGGLNPAADAQHVDKLTSLTQAFVQHNALDSQWHDFVAPEKQSLAVRMREHALVYVHTGLIIQSEDDVAAVKEALATPDERKQSRR